MAEMSGFFEAMWDETLINEETGELGDWDRKYLSKEFAKYFSLFIKSGVFGSPTNQLKVIPGTGMSVIVTEGWAFINGYWYHNDSNKEIPLVTNSSANNRIDSIRIRWTEVNRNALALAFTGDTTVIKSETVYDLQLATVNVPPLSTTISASNITDTRTDENVCGLVTQLLNVQTTADLFEQYNSIFNEWFDSVKGQLTGDLAVRLQLEFNELNDNVQDYKDESQDILNEAEELVQNFVYNDYVIPEQTLIFVDRVCTLNDSKVTENSLIDVYFTADTIEEAEVCQIYVDSVNGAIVLTAAAQPSNTIKALFRVRLL